MEQDKKKEEKQELPPSEPSFARKTKLSESKKKRLLADNPFESKLEVFEWLQVHCSSQFLQERGVRNQKSLPFAKFLELYHICRDDPNMQQYIVFEHQYVEGGTNAYSLNSDTFFSIAMQLDDLIDFIFCERVCRAWNNALKETRLWKPAVFNFILEGEKWHLIPTYQQSVLTERLESIGRKYVGNYQACFFDQLNAWGKPLQSNSASSMLVNAVERFQVKEVKRALENGTDPSFPCGQSSHGNIRTPIQGWFKTITAKTPYLDSKGFPIELKVSKEASEVLELLITKGGLDIFRYNLPDSTVRDIRIFDWKYAVFENGRTLDELKAMLENYLPVPRSLRGWRVYRESIRRKSPLQFTLK